MRNGKPEHRVHGTLVPELHMDNITRIFDLGLAKMKDLFLEFQKERDPAVNSSALENFVSELFPIEWDLSALGVMSAVDLTAHLCYVGWHAVCFRDAKHSRDSSYVPSESEDNSSVSGANNTNNDQPTSASTPKTPRVPSEDVFRMIMVGPSKSNSTVTPVAGTSTKPLNIAATILAITLSAEYGVSKHEEWYERLGRWQEALNTYEKKAQEDPDLLEPELTSFVGEGYGQSHNTLVRAQVLSELEEIIVYKQYADQTDHQAAMQKTWMKRALVLNPEDDPVMWIKFANLCCKSDRMVLTEKTINSLLSPERHLRDDQHLKAPLNIHNSNVETKDHSQRSGVGKAKLEELSRLLARCYFKQGQWQVELKEDRGPVPGQRNVKDILHSYLLATHYDPNWYKAWRTWALANFEVIGHLESQKESMAANIPGSGLAAHTVPAHSEIGFFRSIGLRNENTLQDTLRLLTLWFKFGTHDYVSQAMANGFSMVEVDMWLEVIPQIIACIQTPSINVRRNINNLLTEVRKYHPRLSYIL
ncbi:FAT domain-containing protein [Suillus plorans]|uniref:FAT domain-containing protein n=1 Tax=Suillus plorans TaxID=116603 RepID=A0A9P7AE23_9AGAM|nr:FAT domain-containing protein [Suillus plorans]KAG1786401.1 FAT domain-containing protein [Suillus plorans]